MSEPETSGDMAASTAQVTARFKSWAATLSHDEFAALMFCLRKGAASKQRGGMTRAINEFGKWLRAHRAKAEGGETAQPIASNQ